MSERVKGTISYFKIILVIFLIFLFAEYGNISFLLLLHIASLMNL